MLFFHSPRRLVLLIACMYMALTLGYGLANPPFEATDEIRHYRYIRYLTLYRSLPPVSIETSRELQAHHPPLYYTLAALIAFPIQSDAGPDYSPPINPFWGFRYFEPSIDNKNQYLHSPDDRWPFHSDATLILYVARWLSTLFGLGLALMTYRLGRAVSPENPAIALGAMAFVAFNPAVLHSAASANNDMAAAFFGAWAVVEAVDLARGAESGWAVVRLGLALGLGMLSKVSVGVLAPVVLASMAVRCWKNGRLEIRGLEIRELGIVAGTAVFVAGWWFARNALLTGDPMGLSDYQSAWVGEADRARLIREAISSLPYAWTTVWARFDYGQVVLPDWTYSAWAILCIAALVGLIRSRSQLRSHEMMITGLAIGLALAGWAALMITIPATAHARHILFAYPAVGLLFVTGWVGLIPGRHEVTKAQKENFVALSLSVLVFVFSLFALWGYLWPAFAYPGTVSALPSDATPASANFEGVAEVVGYAVSKTSAQPGARIDVRVYWRPLAQTSMPLQAFVHLVDSNGIIIAQRDTYPGLGNALTTTWRVGETFVDSYRVFLPETIYAPERLTIRVGLWSTAESRPLIVGDADAVTVGIVDLSPRAGDLPNPTQIKFANGMTLIGYSLDERVAAPGGTLLLATHWRAGGLDSDYWAFAHVVGGDGRIWALADSVILPLTTQWALDVTATEIRTITLAADTPPGQYTLEFGVTRVSEAGQSRLPILAEDGHEIGDYVELTKIRVEP